MQNLIERLKIVEKNITPDELNLIAVQEELSAIILGLETIDKKHTRQTDDLRAMRETQADIRDSVQAVRRKTDIWQDEISSLGDDVSMLLHDLAERATRATDDAAAMRGVLEVIRDVSRKAEYTDPDSESPHHRAYIADLLGSVAHQSAEGLKSKTGVALRKDLRQLEALVEGFEKAMQETGGWRYGSDRDLAARVQRCIDHYTRMAAQAVSNAHGFKDGTVSWLRGIAINAQAVSWASTHHEKDARLRGLIEVVENAISKIDQARFDDHTSPWNGVVDSWMRSDFPTREMRRRIFDLEKEIERLRKQVGEVPPVGVIQVEDDLPL